MKKFKHINGVKCVKRKKFNNKLTVRLYESSLHDDPYIIGLDHISCRTKNSKNDKEIFITQSTFIKIFGKLNNWGVL